MQLLLLVIFLLTTRIINSLLTVNSFNKYSRSLKIQMATTPINIGNTIPEGIIVDIVTTKNDSGTPQCQMNDSQDFGKLLKTLKRAIVFAVPGAFTPTCSAQHLPSFIANANEFYSKKGVTDIFCLSVNDKYVMKSWAEATPGCVESNIKMVADGNAEYTQALGLVKDGSGSRMGLRSKRYAAVIEYGVVKLMNVDEKGMAVSSADEVLSAL